MSNIPLGEIITTAQFRDAIHIAVAPVEASCTLHPGERVTLKPDGRAVSAHSDDAIGVVDPFLRNRVQPHDRFWLFLLPNTVTSLRHEWTHPAFKDATPGQVEGGVSRKRIASIADELGCDYDELMEAAGMWVKYGEYFCQGGKFEGMIG